MGNNTRALGSQASWSWELFGCLGRRVEACAFYFHWEGATSRLSFSASSTKNVKG